MKKIVLYNGLIINEKQKFIGTIIIENNKIFEILQNPQLSDFKNFEVFDATGKIIIPGIIDTHVHFRDPGLTHKADMYTESKAAAAGGVTTFFDMPNTVPQSITFKAIEEKFNIAQKKSLINYNFFIGATNNNISEISNLDKNSLAGIKLFYASSTGNMLVDKIAIIEDYFKKSQFPIVVHSEDELIIKKNHDNLIAANNKLSIYDHPKIRSAEGCYLATKTLIELAKKHNTQLHILHLTTKEELELFSNQKVDNKHITAETSPNYLYYDFDDYKLLGNKIKCNPAIKYNDDKSKLIEAINNNLIDTIATDHAPHTFEEKQNEYEKAPSGIPSIQHSLSIMLELVNNNKVTIENIVEKMCHNPAKIFNIKDRGFIKKGYFADLAIIDLESTTEVKKENIYYKCGWSPLEGTKFNSKILATIVNGNFVYKNGEFFEQIKGHKVEFSR